MSPSPMEALSLVGAILWLWRLQPFNRKSLALIPLEDGDLVSIIVPARNEAKVIRPLLKSLSELSYKNIEIILMDDDSTDDTAAIARSFENVKVIAVPPLPRGWRGKTWACHNGFLHARGSKLLFTDADTCHGPDSLGLSLRQLLLSQAQLLSMAPQHEIRTFWEAFMGSFHSLLYALSGIHNKQKPGSAFAIGQYLLFDRALYEQIGGHKAVANELVEDLPLAYLSLKQGAKLVHLWQGPQLRVRMYGSLKEFIQGWRRNFRAGLRLSSPFRGLEATAMIAALIAGGQPGPLTLGISLVLLGYLAFYQRLYGGFHPLSILGLPLALGLFTIATVLSLFDEIFQRKQVWKGRALTRDAL